MQQYKEYVDSKKKKTEVSKESRNTFSQKGFDEAITRFIIHSMVPLRVVEDPYFISIFNKLNFCIMSRRALGRRINSLYEDHCKQVREEISKISFLCTTADIWSGRKRSFIGITAHFIQSYDCKRKSIVLACRRFRSTHSYDKIAQILYEINADFGITTNKVVATITDNGSNFIKAFKVYGVEHQHIDIQNICDMQDFTTDSDTDCSNDGEEELLMPQLGKLLPAHLRCCAHTLSLCVTNDAAKILETSKDILNIHKQVMRKCNLLWKAAMRPKSAEIIQDILGHTLRRPCDTRWNSLYDSLQQVVNINSKCCELFRALNIDHMLNENDFQYLEEHLACAQPIAEAIDILQGEDNTYYGITLPCLVALRRKLRILTEREWIYCASLAKSFKTSVENRFSEFFHFTSAAAKKAAIAALSYPRFKNRWLACIDVCYHKDILAAFEKTVQMGMTEETPCNNHMNTSQEKNFFDFGTPCPQSRQLGNSTNAQLKILQYFAETDEDFGVFNRYPEIKNVCLKYNTPLPSSAPVERLFSFATMTNTPKAYRLPDSNFEKRVILKANMD